MVDEMGGVNVGGQEVIVRIVKVVGSLLTEHGGELRNLVGLRQNRDCMSNV